MTHMTSSSKLAIDMILLQFGHSTGVEHILDCRYPFLLGIHIIF